MRPVRSRTRNPLSAPFEFEGFESADMLISVSEFDRRADGWQYSCGRRHETRDCAIVIGDAVGGRLPAVDSPFYRLEIRTGWPPLSYTSSGPYFSRIGLILRPSPTATSCIVSGSRYFRATRCTSSLVMA